MRYKELFYSDEIVEAFKTKEGAYEQYEEELQESLEIFDTRVWPKSVAEQREEIGKHIVDEMKKFNEILDLAGDKRFDLSDYEANGDLKKVFEQAFLLREEVNKKYNENYKKYEDILKNFK